MRVRHIGRGEWCIFFCVASILPSGPIRAQTTQGIITGRVVDSRTGAPLPGAAVGYRAYRTSDSGGALTDSRGFYSLPPLAPGFYTIRAELREYQARELQTLELNVAARLEIDFSLRPLREVLEPGDYNSALLPDESAILPVIGPDLEGGRSAPLESAAVRSAIRQPSVSYVIDPKQISEAPLAARNVYTMIVTLPGATAVEANGRGLGISVNGQRPSSSNFLLDGAENNDYLLTGPFSAIAPEGFQEYRITTNNFTAEYGRTGGFVANAVTRTGSNDFHGVAYTYLNNDVLNATTFQQNSNGIRRTPQKQLEAGYSLGGPIRKDRLFFSSAFERYRSRALNDPQNFIVPLPARFSACSQQPGIGDLSRALDLLSRFPPPEAYVTPAIAPGGSPCNSLRGIAQFAPRVSLDRTTAVERVDFRSPSGKDRLMARVSISRITQPDQQFSVYSSFNGAMVRKTSGVALRYERPVTSLFRNELNTSWRNAGFNFARPLHTVPTLTLNFDPRNVYLPGQSLPYEFTENEHDWALSDNATWTHGSHILTIGAGALLRRLPVTFSLLPTPIYGFRRFDSSGRFDAVNSMLDFALSRPTLVLAAISREAFQSRRIEAPDPRRRYSDNEFFGFAQDSWKLTSRFVLNLGMRYESFGTLRNIGAPDGILQPGTGSSFEQRLAGATFTFPRDQAAYAPDRNNWAGRFGLAYSVSSAMTLRAGYGVFYDRPYDNLFLNPANTVTPSIFCAGSVGNGACQPAILDYTQPIANVLTGRVPLGTDAFGAPPLWVDRGLRTPYVQSWFAGIQEQFTDRWYFEITHMGSLGRKLMSSSLVNQEGASGRTNPNLPALWFRSNSGSSVYTALGALARYRATRADFQVSYTWSHSIDNQSDALAGDPFDLSRFNPENAGVGQLPAQFNNRADRGSSDFDIRHNLVLYSIWRLPGKNDGWMRHLTSGWQMAQIADFRTGLPYSVYNALGSGDAGVIQSRPDVVPGVDPHLRIDTKGGVQLLNAKAFSNPVSGRIGNLGRNTFSGPGFWNVDLSLARSFSVARLGESRRIQFRADAFNLFNHANLGLPDSILANSQFGRAAYGPTSNASAFPALTPLYPSPRRVQLQVKLYF
jgi:hypothetical protein